MLIAIRVAGFVAALLILGCGGGSRTTSFKLTGTVATGAPLVGASVEVFNGSGSVGEATTDSKGDYITTALTGAGPYVIKAILGDTVLYSVQVEPNGKPVNVTPLTNIVATMLSPTGNPENLISELNLNKNLLSQGSIEQKKKIVSDLIRPVTAGLGIDVDIINSAMITNGTGLDRVLDTIRVSIIPSANRQSSIQVAFIKGHVEDTQEFTFSSSDEAIDNSWIDNYKDKEFTDKIVFEKLRLWARRTNRCIRIPAKSRWEYINGVKQFKDSAQDCKKLWLNNDPNSVLFTGYKAQEVFVVEFGERTYEEDALINPEYLGYYKINEVKNYLVRAKALLFDSEGRKYYAHYFVSLLEDISNDNELRIGGNNMSHQTEISISNYIYEFPSSPGYEFTASGYSFYIPRLGTTGDQFKSPNPYLQNHRVVSAIVTWPDKITKTYLKDSGKNRKELSVCSGPVGNECSRMVDTSLITVRSDFYNKATGLIQPPLDKSYLAGKRSIARTKPIEFFDFGFKSDVPEKQLDQSKRVGLFTVELKLSDGSTLVQKVPFNGRPLSHFEIIDKIKIYPKLTEATIKDFWVDPKFKVILPFKKDSQGNIIQESIGKFDLKWEGLVQWVYGYGYRGTNGSTPNGNFVSITNDVKSSVSELSLACTYLSSRIGETQCLNTQDAYSPPLFAVGDTNLQPTATHYSGITSIELGNYLSDFGTIVSGYFFFNIFEDVDN